MSVPTPRSDVLAPYAGVLRDPALRATTEQALAWGRRHVTLDDTVLAKLSVVSATYGRNCAPTAASARAYDLATRFILLFLLLDDADEAEAKALVTGDEPWSIGPFTPALRSFLADCQVDGERAPPALKARFERAYHDYLRARAQELTEGARPEGFDAHLAFRRRTIFLDPYIDLWMILLGIDPDAVTALDRARRSVIDVVLLANDIGSVERDRAGGEAPEDLNLLDTVMAERGCTRADAVEILIERHDALVVSFRDDIRAARSSGEVAYADLLAGMIDGNLRSLRTLAFRYPGASALLGRLPLAREPAP